jgi:3-hydroxybutyryl-CoA dehydrogenase
MKIVVIGNMEQQEHWKALPADAAAVSWQQNTANIPSHSYVLDLLFDGSPERISSLLSASPDCCLVNSVTLTCAEFPSAFARFNGWPGFAEKNIVEAAYNDADLKGPVTSILTVFGRTPEWVKDVPGFISARIVSMIINEAYLGSQEQVSDRASIDTAMKLGTGYPFGPFEWCRKIGPEKVYQLLMRLSADEIRYTPAESLKMEAMQS